MNHDQNRTLPDRTPDLKALFDIIHTVKNADRITVTIATGISHTPVVNRLENPRINITPIGDEVSLLIQGRKTYSFDLSRPCKDHQY